jgi:hypothetical protein
MAPFATRAVRLMSTAHTLRRDVGRGVSTLFTPQYFPMTLGVTCLGSLLAGFLTFEVIQNNSVRSSKLRNLSIMAERKALIDQISRTVACRLSPDAAQQEKQEIEEYVAEHRRRANDPHLARRFTLSARWAPTRSHSAFLVSSVE